MAFTKLKDRRGAGFTLVELLIVIVVIAILAAITIIAYNGVTQKARTSQAVSAANSVQQVAELVNTSGGHYPIDKADFNVSCLVTKLPASITLELAPSGTFTAGTTAATAVTGFTGVDNNAADSQNIGYLVTTTGDVAPTASTVNGGVIYNYDYSAGALSTTLHYVGSATSTSKPYALTNTAASFSTCN